MFYIIYSYLSSILLKNSRLKSQSFPFGNVVESWRQYGIE